MKFVLIGCAVILVIAIAVAIGVGYYVRSHSAEWLEQGKAIRTEGTSFGAKAAEPQCLSEAMARYRSDRGMRSGIKQGVWLGGCLETSSIDPQFCTDVPPEAELLRTAAWRNERCAEFGMKGDTVCPSILQQMQRYCFSPERRKKLDAAKP